VALMADSQSPMSRLIQDTRFQIRQDGISPLSIGKAGRFELQQVREETRIPSVPPDEDHTPSDRMSRQPLVAKRVPLNHSITLFPLRCWGILRLEPLKSATFQAVISPGRLLS